MKTFFSSLIKSKRSTLYVAIFGSFLFLLSSCNDSKSIAFKGDLAYERIGELRAFGARVPASDASLQAIGYIKNSLSLHNWHTTLQEFTFSSCSGTNIIASRGSGNVNILLGTHFDSRAFADATSTKEGSPVPGVNDGLSGTSILLELASMRMCENEISITLAFFDCEDQGGINDQVWAAGSQYFVDNLSAKPDMAVIIDMVGDKNLNIYQEINSSNKITNQIWDIATKLGHEKEFISMKKYSLLDDHIPFIKKKIPAALIIDFDYSYWHTLEDTIEHIDKKSLQIVGTVLFEWLKSYCQNSE